MDRRALFFIGAAFVCLLLSPVADPAHRWVALTLAIVYAVLAGLSALDKWSRTSAEPRNGNGHHPSNGEPAE